MGLVDITQYAMFLATVRAAARFVLPKQRSQFVYKVEIVGKQLEALKRLKCGSCMEFPMEEDKLLLRIYPNGRSQEDFCFVEVAMIALPLKGMKCNMKIREKESGFGIIVDGFFGPNGPNQLAIGIPEQVWPSVYILCQPFLQFRIKCLFEEL